MHQHFAVFILIQHCVIENSIAFAPKYRRKVFYEEKREAIREILRTLCQWKGVEIIEGEGPVYG